MNPLQGEEWPVAVWCVQIRGLLNPRYFYTDSPEQARGWEKTGALVRRYPAEHGCSGEGEEELRQTREWEEWLRKALHRVLACESLTAAQLVANTALTRSPGTIS